jgi:hypothetical protein
MGNYGLAALKAVALLASGKIVDPTDAWRQATISPTVQFVFVILPILRVPTPTSMPRTGHS